MLTLVSAITIILLLSLILGMIKTKHASVQAYTLSHPLAQEIPDTAEGSRKASSGPAEVFSGSENQSGSTAL